MASSFHQRYGITRAEARKLDRALGGTGNAPARGVRAATTTRRGVRLLAGEGPAGAEAELAEVAQRAAAHRGLVANAVAAVRAGQFDDVRAAERAFGLPAGAVRRQMPGAFDRRGQLRGADRAAVVMRALTPDGPRYVLTRGSRARQLVGRHAAAVQAFAATGDASVLEPFAGKRVGGVNLVADPDIVEALFVVGAVEAGPYPEAPVR